MTENQQAYLDQLRRILPASPEWEAWLQASGELPPDFATRPASYQHPDLLAGVADPAGWTQRRAELTTQLQHWLLGTVPPAPDNLHIELLSEHREQQTTVREVQLSFGEQHAGKLWLQLLIPDGVGPFPVFITQHHHRAWAQIALRRGYIACIYAGADTRDDTDTFLTAYPGYDWSRITRRAWAASRCVDYLESEPLADSDRIAITGHSRNGKLSLIAAALDERFAVVISSSSGSGGALSARTNAEPNFGESIEFMTRRFPDWFHPRWRFFVGREDQAPVDIPDLIALSAPRPCLLSIALNDHVSNALAIEQTYHAVQPVYAFLGAADHLRILHRYGAHETWAWVIERYIDWCDLHFGRGDYVFPLRLIYPQPARAPLTTAVTGLDLPAQITALLGTAPPAVVTDLSIPVRENAAHLEVLLNHVESAEVAKTALNFGEHINANIYRPAGKAAEKLPVILWLPPFSPPHGYAAGYKLGEHAYSTLALAGFAVFCFDPIGTGQRIEEIEHFYQRHPGWSVLGKTIRDAQAALDCIGTLPDVDNRRIYAVGYNFGSLVGLHLAALDSRIRAFAGVAIPPAFRTMTYVPASGGLDRWRLFWPQLAAYTGRESAVPYDVADLIAAIAPRPTLIVSPQLDRENRLADAQATVAAARATFSQQHAADQLTQLTPETYNHFNPDTQALVIDWLQGLNS